APRQAPVAAPVQPAAARPAAAPAQPGVRPPLPPVPGAPSAAPVAAPAPAAPASAVPGAAPQRAPIQRRRPAPGEHPTVLLVDDNTDLLLFLREGLGNEFKVVTATNGEEALDRIIEEGFQPAVVITDIMMPVMDGLELTRRLKRDAYTQAIPIIMLTAKDELQAKIEGLTAGADDYITKPFNLEVLTLRLKKLIYASPSSQQAQTQAPNYIDPEPHKLEITPLDTQLVDKATRYIEEHVSRSDLSVEELSAHIGMSRVHLYKKIKQITGKTPTEFIRTIRLKMARQMLAESQLNVQEVAFKLGFSSPRSFSKYFMEEFGVLPSHYQRRR
ncbi:MAG: response regulator, partial [Muribaculaceae bacterium]|nr:response regulator [Muribaculaceae bacterium]